MTLWKEKMLYETNEVFLQCYTYDQLHKLNYKVASYGENPKLSYHRKP